jgi:hypothetical protein
MTFSHFSLNRHFCVLFGYRLRSNKSRSAVLSREINGGVYQIDIWEPRPAHFDRVGAEPFGVSLNPPKPPVLGRLSFLRLIVRLVLLGNSLGGAGC